ncbi:MAG: hypothetical protein AB7R87_05235 [Parvibaculaceae bacterium]
MDDAKLFDRCLNFALDDHVGAVPRRLPFERHQALDLAGTIAPPDLVKETLIVGNVPWQIKKFQGQWALRLTDKSFLYAAFVERLTPTEMTIALVLKPKEELEFDPARLRQKLAWEGTAFVGRHSDLFAPGEITFIVGTTRFGDVMTLAVEDGREAHLLGCLFSERRP